MTLRREKIFRVYFSWLGQDKGDYIDVYGNDVNIASNNAVKIENLEHRSNYKNTDIFKVELVAEVQTTLTQESQS